jgi:hypothetical protein
MLSGMMIANFIRVTVASKPRLSRNPAPTFKDQSTE